MDAVATTCTDSWQEELTSFLTTYQTVIGETLGFFHDDPNWNSLFLSIFILI